MKVVENLWPSNSFEPSPTRIPQFGDTYRNPVSGYEIGLVRRLQDGLDGEVRYQCKRNGGELVYISAVELEQDYNFVGEKYN